MNEIALDIQPWGFCPECMKAFLNGSKPVQVFTLTDGSRILEAHCPERSVGALLHLRPGKPQRWKLTVPIDAIEWHEQIVPGHLSARAALIQAVSAPSAVKIH